MKIKRIIEYLFYAFVFLLPWQTVFLVREIFVGGEKWQYGTVGVYLSDVVLVLLLMMVGVSRLRLEINLKFKILNLKSIFKDKFKSKICKLCHFDRSDKGAERRNLNLSKVRGNIWAEISRFSASWRITRDDNLAWFVVLFLVWSGLSVFWAPDKFLAGYFAFKMCLGVGLFFVIQEIRFDWKKLIFVLLFGAVIQSGLGSWQYLAQETFSSKWLGMSEYDSSKGGVSVLENETGRWIRAYGAFVHPNMLGGFLVLVLLLVFSKINNFFLKKLFIFKEIYNKNITLFSLLLIVFLIIVMGILFSFSRSAWVALIVGLVVFLVCHFDRSDPPVGRRVKWRNLSISKICDNIWGEISRFVRTSLTRDDMFKWVLILGIFIVLIIGINRENFFSRFDSSLRLEQKSVSDRMGYVSEARKIISDNFLFGVGVGNYTLEVMKNDRLQSPVWQYQPVHNVFILVFAELGLVGFILFGLFLVSIAVRVNLSYYPILAALFVFMMLDHWLWTSHFGMLFFWLILCLTCCERSRDVELK